jgi:hypothetical protein
MAVVMIVTGRSSHLKVFGHSAGEKAGFHLGFAAALELLGVNGRGSPERQSESL